MVCWCRPVLGFITIFNGTPVDRSKMLRSGKGGSVAPSDNAASPADLSRL
jgi:hypothetical protein